MAVRKKTSGVTEGTLDVHAFTVVLEDIRSQFGVFGEALQGLRQHVDVGFGSLRTDIQELRTEVTGLQAKVTDLRTEVMGLQKRVTSLETEVTGLRTEVTGLQKRVTGLETEVAGLRTEVTGLRTEVTGLETEVTGLRTEVTGLRTEMTGLRTEVTGLETEVTGLRTEVTGLRTEVTGLRAYVDLKFETFRAEVARDFGAVRLAVLENSRGLKEVREELGELRVQVSSLAIKVDQKVDRDEVLRLVSGAGR